jgi:hypothetical protein
MEDGAWGRFHSRRFQLSVPLPDGRTWKIDDRSRPELTATHEPTASRLTLWRSREDELMNRHKCEARARARGSVPDESLPTIDDHVTVGPDAYDSRVLVLVDPGRPGGAMEGHVLLFGAFLRQCLFFHLVTRVPGAMDDDVLSARLAVARERIVGGITMDPPRTTDSADVPRDRPDVQR